MKYTYKLKKVIYHEVVFEEELPGHDQHLESVALRDAKRQEESCPSDMLHDGDEWEVEESMEEED